MKSRSWKLVSIATIWVGLLLVFSASVVQAHGDIANYKVTLENLTSGQPFSPPVAATHRGGIRMFKVGKLSSSELEAIAEDGNQIPMFKLFDGSNRVTDVVDIGMPLTPSGRVVGDFTDAVTFEIKAQRWDKLSLATMLICTNDGFTGLNRIRPPRKGSSIRWLNGYDAGTEDNTELSQHIVDPCSALGPVPLAGDPNGNEDAAVDTKPHQPIQHHPNISGRGDLSGEPHAWVDPVAKVTITRIADNAKKFRADLSGVGEVPLVQTVATGNARFTLHRYELDYVLNANFIIGVTQAHIHMGLPNENGPIVAFLFGLEDPGGAVQGRLARGTITEADLSGPLVGDFAGFVKALRSGDLYVNVHTAAHPPGEIRGQIGVVP
ncbi:MAG: spondin domain-containing protein [Acidiferrobacterales bacterium]